VAGGGIDRAEDRLHAADAADVVQAPRGRRGLREGVADFTYVSTWQGWQCVAFVFDVFARRIVGWGVGSSLRTDVVLDALEQALYARQPERDRNQVIHSDRGSQRV
jgi:transposase InsO family protein